MRNLSWTDWRAEPGVKIDNEWRQAVEVLKMNGLKLKWGYSDGSVNWALVQCSALLCFTTHPLRYR